MPEWLQALALLCRNGTPSILITVADAKGSTPRGAGTRMVVTAEAANAANADNKLCQYDTIGGGHLEWKAIAMAQVILGTSDAAYLPQLHRFPLGPALGQCCGGTMHLLFEKIDADAASEKMIAALMQAWREGRDVWRLLPLEPGARAELLALPDAATATAGNTTHVGQDAAGRPCLYDYCSSDRPQVLLFGAGHVGRALATQLSALRCRVVWVDERDDLFPALLPPNVTVEVTDDPAAVVTQAAPGSYFLVMTHSHAIDQQLSERILRRNDAAWFGLIGSDTKRALFLSRLAQRGLSEQQLAGLTCPIGIAGVNSKEPAAIAVAVAAQLLQLWER